MDPRPPPAAFAGKSENEIQGLVKQFQALDAFLPLLRKNETAFSFRRVQLQCKALGVNAKGNRKVLVGRLEEKHRAIKDTGILEVHGGVKKPG